MIMTNINERVQMRHLLLLSRFFGKSILEAFISLFLQFLGVDICIWFQKGFQNKFIPFLFRDLIDLGFLNINLILNVYPSNSIFLPGTRLQLE